MSKKNGHNTNNCDKLRLVESLQQSDKLDIEITREQGQIVVILDEAEKYLESRLNQIKRLRYSVKEKQKQKRKLTEKCGTIATNQLLELSS